jgi:hypothetical protein
MNTALRPTNDQLNHDFRDATHASGLSPPCQDVGSAAAELKL